MKRLRKIGCMAAVLFVTVWVALSPLVSPSLYYGKLFWPERNKGNAEELANYVSYPNHEVYFPAASGVQLHGWLFKNPNSQKIVLFYTGNAGDISRRVKVIDLLLKSGVSVFIYEPRGFGKSPGSVTLHTYVEDGLSAYDYLRAQGHKPQDIILYGESLGSGVATYVSTKRPAAAIITQGAFASLERIAKEREKVVRLYPGFLFPNPSFNNARLMSKNHPPLLILHGELDSLIPIRHGEILFAEATGPKFFVRFPNSYHSDILGADLDLFVETVSEFIATLP